MTEDEVKDFLAGPYLTRIATLQEDGTPYVIPSWFEYSGGNIQMVVRTRSAWLEHIRRDPRVSLVVDEEKLPYRKVIFEGRGEVVGTDWVELGRRLATRYFANMDYLEASMDQPRVVVKITPNKITSWKATGKGDHTEWHPRYLEPGTRWYNAVQEDKKTA